MTCIKMLLIVSVPLKNVSGVLLQKAHLPCDIKPKQDDDTVFMVLWFKDTEAEPIYR